MSEFVIEKGVPAPERTGWAKKYPFDGMSVGDSFVVPSGTKFEGQVAAQGNVWAKRKSLDWRFVSRTVDGVVRVWRVR